MLLFITKVITAAVIGGILGGIALPMLGFRRAGVVAGSLAAVWQSSIGGVVGAGSLFAILQSLGATGGAWLMGVFASSGAVLVAIFSP